MDSQVKLGGKIARGLGLGSSDAATALAAVNPCDQSNVALVCDFQKSVQQPPDGKYGTDTAHALVRQIPTAPGGCHPRPAWWAAHGKSNCGQTVVTFPADVIVGHRQPTQVAGTLPQMPGFPELPQMPYQVSPWVSLIPGALTPIAPPSTQVPTPGNLPGQNLPGQYLPGQLGDPAQGDALFTATQTLLTALSNSTGFPTAISCNDTNVASAAMAFQQAFNAAPTAGNTSVPITGSYDAATQLALQSTINTYQALTPPVSFTSGSAAKPCVTLSARRSPPPAPPPLVSFQASAPVGNQYEFPADAPPAPPVVSVLPPPAPPVVQTQPAPPAPPPPPTPPVPPAPVDSTTEEYVVQLGDSPEIISRRFGIPFHELARMNPHKPTRPHARGVHTWHTLQRGERLRVPRRRGGRLGDESVVDAYRRFVHDANGGRVIDAAIKLLPAPIAAPITPEEWVKRHPSSALPNMASVPVVQRPPALDAAHALAKVNPCDQANMSLVQAFQQSIGKLDPDGKYGHDTAMALAALVPGAAAACAHQAWWGPAPQLYVAPPPAPPPVVATQPAASQPAASPASPAAPPPPADTMPADDAAAKKGGLSTGAIVAGGIGVAALVGIIVAVATGDTQPVVRRVPARVGEKKRRRR